MNVIPQSNSQKPKAKEKNKPLTRPLSAYNLFFRFKRQQILRACKEADPDKETIKSIVNCKPGLEFVNPEAASVIPDDGLEKFRSDRIRADLEDKLTPKYQGENTRRVHRKTKFNHGLSFLDMSKIISSSWKECDDLSKKLFESLAEDGRIIVREQLLAQDTKAQEEEKELTDLSREGEDESNKRQEVMLAKTFDSVRPNAIHKQRNRSVERGAASKDGRVAEEVYTEHHDNANIYPVDYTQRMYREHPQQPSSSVAATATDLALLNQANAAAAKGGPVPKPVDTTSNFPMGHSLINPPSNIPYLPASLLLKLSSSTSTSTADKLKMTQLEAANESMKMMLEQLVAVNTDLKGQNAHLIQLVGQLRAENSALKRNTAVGQTTTEKGVMQRNIFAVTHSLSQGHGFPNSQPHVKHSASSNESEPQQDRIPPHNLLQSRGFPYRQPQGRHSVSSIESAPQQKKPPQHITKKKRQRVNADPWSKPPFSR